MLSLLKPCAWSSDSENMLPQALRKEYWESEDLIAAFWFHYCLTFSTFLKFSKLNLGSLICKMGLPPPTCVTGGLSELHGGRDTCNKALYVYY